MTPKKNSLFCHELKRAGFKIFQPISDHGFFKWKPCGPYKRLSELRSASEITDCIHLDAVPSPLVDVSKLRLPHRFGNLPLQEHKNDFPYGQKDIGCLHVGSKHRGIKFHDVDFAFGGSILGMLARQNVSDGPCLATRVPGTDNKTILVVRCLEYVQNYADLGFQFERLVTGYGVADRPSVEFIEHLHLMQVGTCRVFFRAETDALYNGESVEVKSSNPSLWGTRIMFQMISNGSPYLCHGLKRHGCELVGVELRRLSDVVHDACEIRSLASMEHNILSGMAALKKQMEHAEEGMEFEIIFSWRGGHMQL